MVAIKLNGVRKTPGRPTLVHGIEGRRHVNNKILRALEASQKNYSGYSTYSSYSSPSDGMNWDEEINKLGQENSTSASQHDDVAESFQWYPGDESSDGETQIQDSYEYVEQNEAVEQNECGDQNRQDNCELDFLETSEHAPPTDYSEGATEEESITVTTTVEIPQSLEEGFEIGPALRACIEETNSYPIVTEHQLRCLESEPIYEAQAESEIDNYFDYPEDSMPCESPENLEWLEEFEKNESRIQRNRTSILRVPATGVVSSCRGTIELLVHADGRTFKPVYNKCGILIAIHCSDGYTLVKSRFANVWSLVDPAGEVINDDAITAVAFDRQGNLAYRTESGRVVTLYTDGQTITTA